MKRPPTFTEPELPEVVEQVGPRPEASPRARTVLAIDPGPVQSAFVLLRGDIFVLDHGIEPNESLLAKVQACRGPLYNHNEFAIEMIASYGMAVGESTFETCLWIGRFIQAVSPAPVTKVYRREVKMHLCGSMRAKDANVRQALLDRIGPQGTKKAPGPLYGVTSHAWAALGVAVTYLDSNP
jgi:hypothetical protein